jgi:hypothetical protein
MTPTTALEQARDVLRWGGQPVPYARGRKGPQTNGWTAWRFTEDDLAEAFADDVNLGMFTGLAGFADVDLDAPEPLQLARHFLPESSLSHGRHSTPQAHRWYVTDPPLRTMRFYDPLQNGEEALLLELRGLKTDGAVGLQTMIPPSIHPGGEVLCWDHYGAPTRVDPDELVAAVDRLAAAALLCRYWPAEGMRHECSLALAGALLLGGIDTEDAAAFVRAIAIAAADPEVENRVQAVHDTADRIEQGERVTSLPRLREIIDPKVVARLADWLGLLPRSTLATLPIAVDDWPAPLNDAAYHGLAGQFVQTIAPHTEADPVAILVQHNLLIGTLAGRGPHVRVGADRHRFNEYALLVGDSSKARKGTSAGPVRNLASTLDQQFSRNGFTGGLSSGEGLIDAVRDPVEELKWIREKGQPPRQELAVVDPGVADKRLLLFEPEFSRVLRCMMRRENTLSAILRQAWDGDPVLRVLTRTSRLRATDAHVSLVGHIGRDELLRYLDSTESGNGFGNRFGFFCVQRANVLPFGGTPSDTVLAGFVERYQEVLEFARALDRPMAWSDEAGEQWRAVYPTLSAGHPGLFGAVTARAEAHALRFACQYALLDCSAVIHPPHLRAALALWQYAEDSARVIFGDALGDRTADAILRVLRRTQGGLGRTELSDVFGRNLPASEIERALMVLLKSGKAARRFERTGGRPLERWEAMP